MPVVSAEAVVPVDPATAFAVSQLTGAVRRRWDPFISEQHFLDEADVAAKGVRTFTRQRFGLSMVSRYVSYAPPTTVGMVMERGPWFFAKLGGGWRFTEVPEGTLAVWKYNFSCRPAWLAPLAERIGARVLGAEIRRRLDGFVRGCQDPEVLAAVSR
ncbi:SRPBCC family protein [Microbacterium sp. ANT_H45B]|uniref:SRPBCC family protein n=1 Tax=Microbacterium sp. ANT_H45B TaxID=2597346 RepID=UPI0011EFAFC5|nr:SRPBCC family protein [Microbacterium sp. ANT_H45B]KAA0961444.1 SRPBCC family protein [Microbacterium sp. ANT_H45B]